jgi:hypothetical protein
MIGEDLDILESSNASVECRTEFEYERLNDPQ